MTGETDAVYGRDRVVGGGAGGGGESNIERLLRKCRICGISYCACHSPNAGIGQVVVVRSCFELGANVARDVVYVMRG